MAKPNEPIDDGLTDEEREAMASADDGIEGAGEAPAAGDDDEVEGKTNADMDPAPGKTDNAAAGKTDDEGKGADAGAAEADEEDQLAARPVETPLRANAPADADDKLKALADKEATLETKFEDGDITAAEYRKGLAAINDERNDLKWQQHKAELAADMQQQARVNSWNGTVRDFMATDAAVIGKNQPMLKAFDEYVQRITGDAANAALSDRKMLEMAWGEFQKDMSDMGVTFTAKPGAPPSKPAASPPAPKPKRELPPTLARVPQSEIEATDDGKFAALDRLASEDPEAYEAAVAKLQERGEFDDYANSR